MQLQFFPSKTLTIYLAKLFTFRILGMLVLIVLVMQMLDLLGESGKILAQKGNGEAQLWEYVALRTPQLIARFLPYSVLLATIISFVALNQNSEVVAMKSAGLSAHQVLAPAILAALLVAAVSFVFNERIVTRATATLKAWQSVEYAPIPPTSAVRSNVYVRDGQNIMAIGMLSGQGRQTVLERVTYYRRDANGIVIEQLRSPRATFAAPGWRLEAPVRFDVAKAVTERLPATVVAHGVDAAQAAMSSIDADGLNLFELSRAISELREAGRRTSELEGKWWHKFSGPLAAVLMPLLGAIAAFGLARSGQVLIRAVIGMALGFAYFFLDNAALAIGNFGGYPPLVAAWAPFLLFALIGETVLVRTEE
jgi:lipopolysaccharide export system permease protein